MWIWTAATPPRFAAGSAVDTKDTRKGRPPMPYMSQTGKVYRLPCSHLLRVLTTISTTSPWFFRTYSQPLGHLAWPCRDSFSIQTLALTLYNSGGIANSRRCSQTWLSISEEESKGMTSCLMNCFTRRDTALKGQCVDRLIQEPVQQVRYHTNQLDYIAFILIFLNPKF